MPQTVRVEGGGDDTINACELADGEIGILVRMADGHVGAEPGDPVMKAQGNGGTYQFLGTGRYIWSHRDGDRHRVRRLRPGERVVFQND